MKPDCLCRKKESEKISADKMYPSLYPILLRGEKAGGEFYLFFIFFICRILYLFTFLFADKMYPSLNPILLREEEAGGEFYLIFTLGHPSDHKLPLVMVNLII